MHSLLRRPWIARLWPLWVASLVALALYLPALGYGPVTDDKALILENPHFGSLGGLWDLVTMDVWASSRHGEGTEYYRPFAMVTLWLTDAVGGGAPWAHRLGNLAAHVAAAWLLWLALEQRLDGSSRRLACVVAAIWLIHPLHSEVVIWLAGRFDVLCGLCLLGAWVAQGSRLGTGWRLVLSIALGCLALGSKELAVPGLMLLAADAAWIARWPRRAVVGLAGAFFACGAGYLMLRGLLGVRTLGIYADLGLGGLASATTQMLSTYLSLALAPTNLDAFHEYHPLSPAWSLGGLAALAAAATALMRWSARSRMGASRLALWGFAFTLAALLPAVVAGPGLGTYGDRYAYVPSMGACALAGALLDALRNRRRGAQPALRPSLVRAAVLLFACVCAARSALRVPDWRSEETLARAMIRDDPTHSYGRYVLGYALATGGRPAEAEPFLLASAKLNPGQWRTWNALCYVHLNLDRLAQAAEECAESLRLHSGNARTWLNLATVRMRQGQWTDAVAYANRALALRPCYAAAFHLKALALANSGQTGQAVEALTAGRRCDPNHAGLRDLESQLAASGALGAP